MAQKTRQNKIFAAEDYTVVYESYVNANFQAFDYDTIREAMVDYVRNTYPENYNDWIESAEFGSVNWAVSWESLKPSLSLSA